MLQKDIITGNRLPRLKNIIYDEIMPGSSKLDIFNIMCLGHISLLRAKSIFDKNYKAAIRYEAYQRKLMFWPSLQDYAAACYGHLEIIRFLRECGITCSFLGADRAASYGHLEVVQELRSYKVNCTSHGADRAAGNGHFAMVRDLTEHGIYCSKYGIKDATINGHLEIVRFLEKDGRYSIESDDEYDEYY